MTYAILLISPGRWQQPKTQQPIGVVGLVIIHVNASLQFHSCSELYYLVICGLYRSWRSKVSLEKKLQNSAKFAELFNNFCVHLPGAPIKNNPLEKVLYLRNCSRFFHQIYAVYRGGFRPCILQIAFKY